MFRVPGIYVYRYILDTLLALLQALASNQLRRNGSEVHVQKKKMNKIGTRTCQFENLWNN